MTAPAIIKEADLARIMKAAKKADFPRVRITIDVSGTIVVDLGEESPVTPARANPLDRILDQ